MCHLALLLLLTLTVALPSTAFSQSIRTVAPDGGVLLTNAAPAAGGQPESGAGGAEEPGVPSAVPAQFAPYVREAATRHGVPARLVAAVIEVESAFNPRAVSRKGAQGLMQLMPATAAALGVRNVFDPAENVDGGTRHLRGLLDRLGDLSLALAAYNAGEQAVAQYNGIPPYPETQDYVARILRLVDERPRPAVPVRTASGSAPAPGPAFRPFREMPPLRELRSFRSFRSFRDGRSAREPSPGEVGQAALPAGTYRTTAADGTATYTNIPPLARR